jgi:hypothetical protein
MQQNTIFLYVVYLHSFMKSCYTLFEKENERQKTEPVPIPLPRVVGSCFEAKKNLKFFC